MVLGVLVVTHLLSSCTGHSKCQDGFWEVAIQSVRLGNLTVHACAAPHGCRGIIDTGASRLGAPRHPTGHPAVLCRILVGC